MKNGRRLSLLSLVVITEQETKKYVSMFWWLQQENSDLQMDVPKHCSVKEQPFSYLSKIFLGWIWLQSVGLLFCPLQLIFSAFEKWTWFVTDDEKNLQWDVKKVFHEKEWKLPTTIFSQHMCSAPVTDCEWNIKEPCGPMEFCFKAEGSINSVNLSNRWNMNLVQFVDCVCYLCRGGNVVCEYQGNPD